MFNFTWGWLGFTVLPHQPLLGYAQRLGEKGEGPCPRSSLAVDVLAELAFSEFLTFCLGALDDVHLLHAAVLHRLPQTRAELLAHR